MRLITLQERTPVGFIIADQFGNDLLIQSDWDYPGLARSFGWVMKPAGPCSHYGTDGTVNCPACGKTATEFISGAFDYLDDNIGTTVADPGYFEE